MLNTKMFIILACLTLMGCGHDSSESNLEMGKYHTPDNALALEEEIEMEAPRTTERLAPSEFSLEKGSKIIKNGSMNFEVTKLEVAKNKVDEILKRYDGYYENEQYNAYGNRISYALQLRIPNTNFDSLIYIIEKGIGEMKSKNIRAKDVTEEYVDLNIRLENNNAYLNQYKEILTKAKSIKEILEVREKIRRIEEEINSKKGRLKFLDDKVKYSTLNLEISELLTAEISKKPKFGIRLAHAFNNGVQSFLSFFIGLVSLWPFVILLMLLFVGRKPILNMLSRKNSPPKE